MSKAKICHIRWEDEGTYTITAEGDILFPPETTQEGEVLDLVAGDAVGSDQLEQRFLQSRDENFPAIFDDKGRKARHGSD